jgi:hypothetical protein
MPQQGIRKPTVIPTSNVIHQYKFGVQRNGSCLCYIMKKQYAGHRYGRFPLKKEPEGIAVASSLYGWVAGSDTLGSLCTLPFPFLALGPISSIMYLHPSIGRLRLKMWVLIKLAICNHIFQRHCRNSVSNSIVVWG